MKKIKPVIRCTAASKSPIDESVDHSGSPASAINGPANDGDGKHQFLTWRNKYLPKWGNMTASRAQKAALMWKHNEMAQTITDINAKSLGKA